MRSSICFELPPWREAQKFIFYALDSLFDYSTLPNLVEWSLTWQECQLNVKGILKSYTASGQKKFNNLWKVGQVKLLRPKSLVLWPIIQKKEIREMGGVTKVFMKSWMGLEIPLEILGGSWKSLLNFGWVLKFTLNFLVVLKKIQKFENVSRPRWTIIYVRSLTLIY